MHRKAGTAQNNTYNTEKSKSFTVLYVKCITICYTSKKFLGFHVTYVFYCQRNRMEESIVSFLLWLKQRFILFSKI